MSEDYFAVLTKRLNILNEELTIFQQRIGDVERREKSLETAQAELRVQQVELNKREAQVNERHSRLTVLKDEANSRVQEQEIRQKRISETIEEIKKQQETLDKRFGEFDKLEIEARNLKEYETKLQVKEKELKDLQFLIDKEKIIDRERKAILDKREQDLDQEKERIQRLAER